MDLVQDESLGYSVADEEGQESECASGGHTKYFKMITGANTAEPHAPAEIAIYIESGARVTKFNLSLRFTTRTAINLTGKVAKYSSLTI